MAQALALFFGLLIGSFLNVCIWRMPRSQSIAWPASHCPFCKKPIRWFDNIPVLAWCALRGRCRDCAAPIPVRYPAVELLGGLAGFTAFTAWSGPYAAAAAVIFWALIVVVWVDWEHQIIPDEISVGGVAAGLIFSSFFPQWITGEASRGIWWAAPAASMAGILTGGGILYLMAVIGEKVFKKEAMGGGDVKLLAAVGAFFGWKGALFTLFAGSVAGSVAGLGVKIFSKKEEIPFGPYLAAGAVLYMFWGEALLSWYLSRVLQY